MLGLIQVTSFNFDNYSVEGNFVTYGKSGFSVISERSVVKGILKTPVGYEVSSITEGDVLLCFHDKDLSFVQFLGFVIQEKDRITMCKDADGVRKKLKLSPDSTVKKQYSVYDCVDKDKSVRSVGSDGVYTREETAKGALTESWDIVELKVNDVEINSNNGVEIDGGGGKIGIRNEVGSLLTVLSEFVEAFNGLVPGSQDGGASILTQLNIKLQSIKTQINALLK